MKLRYTLCVFLAVTSVTAIGFTTRARHTEPNECPGVALDIRVERTYTLRDSEGNLKPIPPEYVGFTVVVDPRTAGLRCTFDFVQGGGPIRFEIRRHGRLVFRNGDCELSDLWMMYRPIGPGTKLFISWDRTFRPLHIRRYEDCRRTRRAPSGAYTISAAVWAGGRLIWTPPTSFRI